MSESYTEGFLSRFAANKANHNRMNFYIHHDFDSNGKLYVVKYNLDNIFGEIFTRLEELTGAKMAYNVLLPAMPANNLKAKAEILVNVDFDKMRPNNNFTFSVISVSNKSKLDTFSPDKEEVDSMKHVITYQMIQGIFGRTPEGEEQNVYDSAAKKFLGEGVLTQAMEHLRELINNYSKHKQECRDLKNSGKLTWGNNYELKQAGIRVGLGIERISEITNGTFDNVADKVFAAVREKRKEKDFCMVGCLFDDMPKDFVDRNYDGNSAMKAKFSPPDDAIKKLYEGNLAFVHMFEHGFDFADKDSYLYNVLKKINNQKSGEYSPFRVDMTSSIPGYPAMPVSSIKQGFPMKLFDLWNNVGLMIDGNDVGYVYVSHRLCFNKDVAGPEEITIRAEHIDKSLYAAQGGDMQMLEKILAKADGKKDPLLTLEVFSDREHSDRCKKAMEHHWELIRGKGSFAEGMKAHYKLTYNVEDTAPMMTESLLNVRGMSKIKAIVVYDADKHIGYGPITPKTEKGLMAAVVTKGILKKDFGLDVPIIHYERTKLTDITTCPELKQVVLEKNKVVEALAKSNHHAIAHITDYCSAALGEDISKEYRLRYKALLPEKARQTEFSYRF